MLPRNGMNNPFPIILRNVGYASHRGKSIRTKLINLSLFNIKPNKISWYYDYRYPINVLGNLSDVRSMRELLIQTYTNVYIFQELFEEARYFKFEFGHC